MIRSGIVRFADTRIMAKAFMNAIIAEHSLMGMEIYGNAKIAAMKAYVFPGAGILTMMILMMNTVRTAFLMSIRDGLENIMVNDFINKL